MRLCFFSSRRRHTRYWRDWSSDVCSSDLLARPAGVLHEPPEPGVTLTYRFAHLGVIGGGEALEQHEHVLAPEAREVVRARSEERRVGKECRSWWSAYH